MTRTSQLDAHYAVLQLDALREKVVMSYRPTVEMLIAEIRERAPGEAGRQRLRDLLTRYRANVLEFDDTLVALRAQCGTDPDDLPEADDGDAWDEVARIRASHGKDESPPSRPVASCASSLAAAADDAFDALREGGAN